MGLRPPVVAPVIALTLSGAGLGVLSVRRQRRLTRGRECRSMALAARVRRIGPDPHEPPHAPASARGDGQDGRNGPPPGRNREKGLRPVPTCSPSALSAFTRRTRLYSPTRPPKGGRESASRTVGLFSLLAATRRMGPASRTGARFRSVSGFPPVARTLSPLLAEWGRRVERGPIFDLLAGFVRRVERGPRSRSQSGSRPFRAPPPKPTRRSPPNGAGEYPRLATQGPHPPRNAPGRARTSAPGSGRARIARRLEP